jgi:hypothetical protein
MGLEEQESKPGISGVLAGYCVITVWSFGVGIFVGWWIWH